MLQRKKGRKVAERGLKGETKNRRSRKEKKGKEKLNREGKEKLEMEGKEQGMEGKTGNGRKKR